MRIHLQSHPPIAKQVLRKTGKIQRLNTPSLTWAVASAFISTAAPMITPIGVVNANSTERAMERGSLKLEKSSFIPKAKPANPLCAIKAIQSPTAVERLVCVPSAMPARTLCKTRDIHNSVALDRETAATSTSSALIACRSPSTFSRRLWVLSRSEAESIFTLYSWMRLSRMFCLESMLDRRAPASIRKRIMAHPIEIAKGYGKFVRSRDSNASTESGNKWTKPAATRTPPEKERHKSIEKGI
mmetsp:Transcript_24496/g.62039  ORF Transcript_24496/g.62039 Transcript_24496/m.62039 type:complete len:243 (-) Transcript_24496:189-917(-)